MQITNNTELSTDRIEGMFNRAADGWASANLTVGVRYSRGAIYSGTYALNLPRIYINIGRRNVYPMKIETSIARARTIGSSWWKPSYHIFAADEYQLALFVFLHEFYHYLIHQAPRNTRRKESMCDRFAVKYLVDNCRLNVFDAPGRKVPVEDWMFQDLNAFVASSKTIVKLAHAARRPKKQ